MMANTKRTAYTRRTVAVSSPRPLNPPVREQCAHMIWLCNVLISNIRVEILRFLHVTLYAYTQQALIRALSEVVKHKCDLINMSYGEAGTVANQGFFVKLAEEVTNKHGCIFVSSAGNAGKLNEHLERTMF